MPAECPTCHKTFRTRRKLKKHYQRVHRETLPSSRGIFGVEGVKGKNVVRQKQQFQSSLDFPNFSSLFQSLGPFVTCGSTTQQFSNIQDAINEVSKEANENRHGIVLLSAEVHQTNNVELINCVDLIAPYGRAVLYNETIDPNLIIPPRSTFDLKRNRFYNVYIVEGGIEIQADSVNSTLAFYNSEIDSPIVAAGRGLNLWGYSTKFRGDITQSASSTFLARLYDCEVWESFSDTGDGLDFVATYSFFNCPIVSHSSGYTISFEHGFSHPEGIACFDLTPTPSSQLFLMNSLLTSTPRQVWSNSGATIEVWSGHCRLAAPMGPDTHENILSTQNSEDGDWFVVGNQKLANKSVSPKPY